MDETWLTLRQAARRTGRSFNTIRRWRRQGMPTRLRDGRREVQLDVLLKWLRDKTLANPVHQYRIRKRHAEEPKLTGERWTPF